MNACLSDMKSLHFQPAVWPWPLATHVSGQQWLTRAVPEIIHVDLTHKSLTQSAFCQLFMDLRNLLQLFNIPTGKTPQKLQSSWYSEYLEVEWCHFAQKPAPSMMTVCWNDSAKSVKLCPLDWLIFNGIMSGFVNYDLPILTVSTLIISNYTLIYLLFSNPRWP